MHAIATSAFFRSDPERSDALRVCTIHTAASVEQDLGGISMAKLRRIAQRRVASVVRLVAVGTMFQQHLHEVDLAAHRSHAERGHCVTAARGVDVGLL